MKPTLPEKSLADWEEIRSTDSYLEVVTLVAAEKALGQEGFVTHVTLERQVTLLRVHLLKQNKLVRFAMRKS